MFGDQRFDYRLAAGAFAEAYDVVLGAREKALLFEIFYYAFAGFVAVEACVGAAGRGDFGVFADHLDQREVVAFAGFEIVEIVRGSYFYDAGAEFGIGHVVEDYGDFAIHERKADLRVRAGRGSARRGR